jgi:hypothetical protein
MDPSLDTELHDEMPSQSTEQVNEDGQLALHLFCQNRNVATIQECEKLLAATPSAVFKRDVYGRTVSELMPTSCGAMRPPSSVVSNHFSCHFLQPLFYALKRGCSEDIIRVVFEANPEAVMERDFCGMTPMHLIYHGSKHPNILKSILQYRPSLALKRSCSFAGPQLVRVICSPWESLLERNNAIDVRRNVDLSKQWEKVVLTVSAAHKCRHENLTTHELHVALELPCSPKVLLWFMRMYSEQLKLPMTDGRLPLHCFVSSPAFITHKEADSVIQKFLELYPDAAKIRCNGKLPLHFAIESGCVWNNGLERLLYAYPAARQLPVDNSSMLPFMTMAACETSDLSTLFSLLQEGPELVL